MMMFFWTLFNMDALAMLSTYLERTLFLGRIQSGLPVAESPRLDRLDDFDQGIVIVKLI